MIAFVSKFEFIKFIKCQFKRKTIDISSKKQVSANRKSSTQLAPMESHQEAKIKLPVDWGEFSRRARVSLQAEICKTDSRQDTNHRQEPRAPSVKFAVASPNLLFAVIFLMAGLASHLPLTSGVPSEVSSSKHQIQNDSIFRDKLAKIIEGDQIKASDLASLGLSHAGKLLLSSLSSGSRSSSGNRNRWMNVVPNVHALRHNTRRPRPNHLVRALNRIGEQIGARNTIRVHNAFRDFAWRILSRLSMPTPVIYDLRRQHFYPTEEDTLNDMMYNKNTTKTIRTKRHINGTRRLWPRHRPLASRRLLRSERDDADDEEPDSLAYRFRMRMEDLVSLSRRNLFGRVIRLPSLFPFRRQEGGKSDQEDVKLSHPHRRRSRRRRKELDRQLISINGKQYYVDDDSGELKSLESQDSG